MGLDIVAYSKLTPSADQSRDEDGFALKGFVPYENPSFPGRVAPLSPTTVYDFEKEFHFRAGSYGGYNSWRNWLAQLAGFESAYNVWAMVEKGQTGPFFDLINFSDCEGTLGTDACKKLLLDFDKFADQAGGGWDGELYREWHKAFRLGADDGAVYFT